MPEQAIPYRIDSELPVVAEAEVVVAGGGPGGLGAAVLAARAGAKTLLVERYGLLGGMASVGEIHPFMRNHVDGESLDHPVYTEWIERMQEYVPHDNERMIAKDAAALAAEDLCLDAGVKLLYHHQVADVLTADRQIQALICLSKTGYTAVRGEAYVDCTGDADVAARGGCEFELGGPTGACQPMTTCFKLSHVDPDRVPDRKEINRLYDTAKERGDMNCPRENVLMFDWLDPSVKHFNTTRVVRTSGVNGVELSESELEARKQVRQYIHFLRSDVPGFENARLFSIAHHIGVRETRRIKGLEYLVRADFSSARKWPDAIARVRYNIDIHNPDGSGTEHERMPEGEWYEIPYGCIVPKDLDNLAVGGRPISVDHAVHSSMRVMPPACSVGQAAGLAAAMAVQHKCGPPDLDGEEVRQELVKHGARL